MGSIRIKTPIPGPKSLRLMEERRRYVSSAISSHPGGIFVESAEGARLTDVDGNVFLDFIGGIGSMNVGHGNPMVVRAVTDQAEKLQHTCFMTAMYEPYVALAKMLTEVTPGRFEKKAAFFNSGAEAVENAVKFSKAHTKRPSVISLENGFHGRTLLALALTSKYQPYKAGFGPFPPEVYHFPSPYPFRRPHGMDEEAYITFIIEEWHRLLKSRVTPVDVACVIFEPLQGEGGFIPLPERFVKEVAKICREHGIVLVADEIQCGMGRTGTLFASEKLGVEPDLITLAKSLSNGLPLGAVVGRKEIMDSPAVGAIGGTFGGNPLSCEAALAVLAEIESKKLCERSRALGELLWGRLKKFEEKFPFVGEVRGWGSMLAVELVKNRKEKVPFKEAADLIIRESAKNGVLLLSAGLYGNVVRFLPPLTITDQELSEALDIIEGAMKKVS